MSDEVTKPKGKFKGPGDPREIGKLGGRPRGSKNRPKEDPLEGLNLKQRKYVQNIVQHGMTKTDAGVAAGYSLASAYAAKANIETPAVQEAFRKLMQATIPAEKIARRINEGMDATETKFFSKDGLVIDSRDVIAWAERRKAASLAAQMRGDWNPRQEVEVTHHMSPAEQIRIFELGIKLGFDVMSPEERAALRRSHVEDEQIITIEGEPSPSS
jgi:hypothetical protein